MLYFSGKGCSEFPKKVLILTGIGFYAFISRLLNQPVRNILTGMEYTGTAVVCLFLMFGTAEYPSL